VTANETTPPRVRTGVPGLDLLLGGGLLASRTVLLKGSPGSGKTTLGLQMLVAGARDYDEPGVLLTFEQMPEQLFADAAGFGWDLKDLVAQKKIVVHFIRPEELLEQHGRQENRLLVSIADLVDDFGARRVMIDSISHLRPFFSGEQARAQFMRFLVQLKSMGLTPIMTSEIAPGEGLAALDVYMVDTVIHLDHQVGEVGRPDRRTLEIVKTRGQRHCGGAHPLEIGPAGVTLYPHLYADPEAPRGETEAAPAPISTGVAGLDPLLGGGYAAGSVALLAGLSGTFKTTLAAHFISGADPGRALWITFQEDARTLAAALRGCGIDLLGADGERARVHFLELTPGQAPVEKIMAQAEEIIRAEGIERVGIDSLNDLVAGLGTEAQKQEGALWLLRRLRALGVTTVATQRLTRVTGRNPLSEIAWAELADTIVYLGLVEIESRLEKVISVLKHRGGPTEGDLRSVRHGAHGLCVSDRFVGLSGVLEGNPLGRRKAQIEEIFQPLYFIRDFLSLARDPALLAEQRAGILENLSGETGKLIQLLARYFDEPG